MADDTLSLLRSAFGDACTPYTVLSCDVTSTASELKRAYRIAALRYHPDRILLRRRRRSGGGRDSSRHVDGSVADEDDDDDGNKNGVLMDEERRSHYDRTGKVREDEVDNDDDRNGNEDVRTSPNDRRRRRGNRHRNGRDWVDFFRSVFDEMVGAAARHASSAMEYRGSNDERNDVLRYYHGTCKRDMNKVVECVPYGRDEDVDRWMRDIINANPLADVVDGGVPPRTRRRGREKKTRKVYEMEERMASAGGVDRSIPSAIAAAAKRRRRMVLEDSSSSDEGDHDDDDDDEGKDIADAIEVDVRMTGKEVNVEGMVVNDHSFLLIDTDDDDCDHVKYAMPPRRPTATRGYDAAPRSPATAEGGNEGGGGGVMSKRDKMDYRVARKRRAIVEKEMHVADLIQSVDWSGGHSGGTFAEAAVAIAAHRSRRRTAKNVGGISDLLLSNLEEKYGAKKKVSRAR